MIKHVLAKPSSFSTRQPLKINTIKAFIIGCNLAELLSQAWAVHLRKIETSVKSIDGLKGVNSNAGIQKNCNQFCNPNEIQTCHY
jgi:hypothetical protein